MALTIARRSSLSITNEGHLLCGKQKGLKHYLVKPHPGPRIHASVGIIPHPGPRIHASVGIIPHPGPRIHASVGIIPHPGPRIHASVGIIPIHYISIDICTFKLDRYLTPAGFIYQMSS